MSRCCVFSERCTLSSLSPFASAHRNSITLAGISLKLPSPPQPCPPRTPCLYAPHPNLSAHQLSRYVTRRPKVPIRPISLSYMSPCTRLPIIFPAAAHQLPLPTGSLMDSLSLQDSPRLPQLHHESESK